mgnify:FL=1
MNAVEPIRDPKKINVMKNYLKGKNIRDYALFVVGINVALRISDLLNLKWGDVYDGKNFKIVNLKEGKTKKLRSIKLNKVAQKALQELFESLETLFYE